MAKKNQDATNAKVVNVASPGSVVGIQCGGSIVGSTVTVNGSTATRAEIEDMDRSRNSNPDNPDD